MNNFRVKNQWNQRSLRIFEIKQRAGSPRSQGIKYLSQRHKGIIYIVIVGHRFTVPIFCLYEPVSWGFGTINRVLLQMNNFRVKNQWNQWSPRVFEVTVRAGSPRSQGINISHRGTKPQRNITDDNCRASVYRAIFCLYEPVSWGFGTINRALPQMNNIKAIRECGKRIMELSIP